MSTSSKAGIAIAVYAAVEASLAFAFNFPLGFTQMPDTTEKVAKIAANGEFTCALLMNGTVRCWGRNISGQLGYNDDRQRGSYPNSMEALNSVYLGPGQTAKDIEAGAFHVCAILDDDSLKCWGLNSVGQLGTDNLTYFGAFSGSMQALPTVNLGVGRSAKKIALGFGHTCAILDNDSVKCWGSGNDGQLGLDSTASHGGYAGSMASLPTVDLGVGKTAKEIAAGFYHTCAILDDDSLKCWGSNNYGQLGLDSTTNQGNAPGSMAALPTVNLGTGRTAKAIATGASHTCAILDDDSVKCWGSGSAGALGLDSTVTYGNSPGSMASLPTVNLGFGLKARAIAARTGYTCAILSNNALKCWGYNNRGQLGADSVVNEGATANSMALLQPVYLGVNRFAKSIATGAEHACAVLDDDTVKCWGSSEYGQLGLDDVTARGTSLGSVAYTAGVQFSSGRTAKRLAAGRYHSCAILDDDSLRCWGFNGSGQLGIASTQNQGNTLGSIAALPAINLGVGRKAKQVAVGTDHTCAILDNDSLKCWGYNAFGQLGLDDVIARGASSGSMAALGSVNLGVGRTAKAIALGRMHSCAILDDNKLKCWGSGYYGELGLDTAGNYGHTAGSMAALPTVNLGTGRTAKAISAYQDSTCAILDDDTLKCWGANSNGELGLDQVAHQGNSAGSMAALPTVNLGSGRTAKMVAMGSYHTCAILDNGALKCWGYNGDGQLGLDHSSHQGNLAGSMAALPTVNLGAGRTAKAIACGDYHTCAVLDDNSLKCWGYNGNGQLGQDHVEKLGNDAGEMASLIPIDLGAGRSVDATEPRPIGLGYHHTCALLDNKMIKCWGTSNYGQMGLDKGGTVGGGGMSIRSIVDPIYFP